MRNTQHNQTELVEKKLDKIIEVLESIALRLDTMVWPIYQPPDEWNPLPPNQPYWADLYKDDNGNRDATGGPTLI